MFKSVREAPGRFAWKHSRSTGRKRQQEINMSENFASGVFWYVYKVATAKRTAQTQLLSGRQEANELLDAISIVVDVTLRVPQHVNQCCIIGACHVHFLDGCTVSVVRDVDALTPGGSTFHSPPIGLSRLQRSRAQQKLVQWHGTVHITCSTVVNQWKTLINQDIMSFSQNGKRLIFRCIY